MPHPQTLMLSELFGTVTMPGLEEALEFSKYLL
jgi:hypothetical protein